LLRHFPLFRLRAVVGNGAEIDSLASEPKLRQVWNQQT